MAAAISAKCFLEVAVGSVESSERATRSATGRRRSADAELWRACEPDVVMGLGTKLGRHVYLYFCTYQHKTEENCK
jgi:hypothetical protein